MLWFCLTLGLSAVATAVGNPQHVWIPGRLVAAESVELRVPGAGVQLDGWNPPGGKVRLSWIAQHGCRVAPGDRLARFDVPEKDMRASIQHRLDMAKAQKEHALVALDEELGKLRAAGEVARMEQQKTQLELEKKKDVLARRDLQLAELAVRRATFACDAIGKRIQAFDRVRAAAEALHAERVRQQEQALADLAAAVNRFRPEAPQAGTVRLEMLGASGLGLRRPRRGDWLRPGTHVLTLVSSDGVEVEFLLPEADFRLASLGGRVLVRMPGEERQARATITSVTGVPGRDDRTHNRSFAIVAALNDPPDGFVPGRRVAIGLPLAGHLRANMPAGCVQGVLASSRARSLYVPVLPGIDAVTALSFPRTGTPVQRGRPVAVFDPAPVRHLLRKREEALALARASLDLRARQIDAERTRLGLVADELKFEVERARLLSVKGVGMTPAIQLDKARLDRRMAQLRHRTARQAMAGFESRAAAEMKTKQLALESRERAVDEARRALSKLAVTAPWAGLLIRPAIDPCNAGSAVVRPGQRLIDLVDPTRLEARFFAGSAWPWNLGTKTRVTVRCVAYPDLRLEGVVRDVVPTTEGPVWRVDIGKGDPRLVPGLTVYLAPDE